MKVYSTEIALQEVPDEISLALTISGCPYACIDCHSEDTWDPNIGIPLTSTYIDELLKDNKHITCILFMGGDWDIPKLYPIVEHIKNTYCNLKIALYSGKNSLALLRYKPERFASNKDFISFLDYIKIGMYINTKGGLESKTTNQRMYKQINNQLIDVTSTFHK
jgi:anaerobic ribonucleoside-triphosphate reductase activating protein